MVIDVHCHLGWDHTFDRDFTADALLRKHEECGVDISIVQPGTCHDLESVGGQHDAIAQLSAAHPGRFYGMANPSPHLPAHAYEAELTRCVRELEFIAVKLHPLAHGCSPGSRDGRKVFSLADRLEIPVMVHTGPGIPFANPANLIALAQAFPRLKIILAHSGFMITPGDAFTVLQLCPNVTADLSWTAGFLVQQWVKELGPRRFMLASDHADNCAAELAKLRGCGLSPEELDWILGGTASEVFGLPRKR
jgi:predicted TIM-barrel fold metal-dependent hydrolase